MVKNKGKLLVVDDEENLRTLMNALFRDKFEVAIASDGKECLAKLKTFKPDLILMDMFMPGMSGRETVEHIRADESTKNVKIIFVTVSRFSEAGRAVLRSMGVSDYITKPFDNKDIVRRVNKVLKS